MIIYAAFFPSDHTSRQMIKTIALFPRTLILMHYTTAATLHNGEFLPIVSHLSIFQVKTHTVCSRQTITSPDIFCNAVCHGNIHQLIKHFITLSIHFCDGTRNISYAGVHHEIHMYKVVIGPAGSRAIKLGIGQGQC